METVIKNRGTSCVGVRKTGTTLIRVSTVMGTLYTAIRMNKKGRSVEEIADCIDFDVEIVRKWLAPLS